MTDSAASRHRRSILEKAKQLRDKRAELAHVRSRVVQLQEQFRQTHKTLFDTLAALAASAEAIERDIRREAVEAFYASGGTDKHPAPGVGIRVSSRLVYSPAAALDWAVNHRMALILDVKTFEAVADAALSANGDDTVGLRSFVRREDVVRSTVSPKLDEILSETGHQ
jgi:hypothetical protein